VKARGHTILSYERGMLVIRRDGFYCEERKAGDKRKAGSKIGQVTGA